jgi:amino acid transporter
MTLNTVDRDALRLQSLGYKQELTRGFTRLTNYGMSLSVISITSGISSLFSYGMITGGPVVMIWGWVIVCFFTFFVVFGMAEICSAYPTSGGLYYWTGILVPQRHKPLASWFTGWFNLIGQFAVTAAIDFGLAMLIGSVISLSLNSQWSPQPYHIILIHLMIIISHGICNSLGVRFLSWLTYISTWWQLFAPIIVSLALLICAKQGHQTIRFVFTEFKNETGWTNQVSDSFPSLILYYFGKDLCYSNGSITSSICSEWL